MCLARAGDEFGDALKAGAQRELGSGGVFNQQGEAVVGHLEAVGGADDGGAGVGDALLARASAEAAGVEDYVLGMQRDGALQLGAEGGDGFLQHLRIDARDVDEVVGVDHRAA